jgi:hypothetical protein
MYRVFHPGESLIQILFRNCYEGNKQHPYTGNILLVSVYYQVFRTYYLPNNIYKVYI